MKKTALFRSLIEKRFDEERFLELRNELRKAPGDALIGFEVEMLVVDYDGYVVSAPESIVVGGCGEAVVGVDGGGTVLEIRLPPFPIRRLLSDRTLLSFISAVGRAIRAVALYEYDVVNDYESFEEPCGTHIHLNHAALGWLKADNGDVVEMFSPLAWRTKDVNGDRYEYSSYGAIDDLRGQPWGLEYRGCEAIYYSASAFAVFLCGVAESIVSWKNNEEIEAPRLPSRGGWKTADTFRFRMRRVLRDGQRSGEAVLLSKDSDSDFKVAKMLGFPWTRGYFKVLKEDVYLLGSRSEPRGLMLYDVKTNIAKLISYSGSWDELCADMSAALYRTAVPLLLAGAEVKRRFAPRIGGIFGVVGLGKISLVDAVFVPPG